VRDRGRPLGVPQGPLHTSTVAVGSPAGRPHPWHEFRSWLSQRQLGPWAPRGADATQLPTPESYVSQAQQPELHPALSVQLPSTHTGAPPTTAAQAAPPAHGGWHMAGGGGGGGGGVEVSCLVMIDVPSA
jgi:hypothetical protein